MSEKILKLNERQLVKKCLVMPKDLNPANRLFGGQLASWIDEAAAIHAAEQLGTENIVTLKISEMLFKKPIKQRDHLTIVAYNKIVGTTSLVVCIEVYVRNVTNEFLMNHPAVTCELVFVAIDPDSGSKVPHGRYVLNAPLE